MLSSYHRCQKFFVNSERAARERRASSMNFRDCNDGFLLEMPGTTAINVLSLQHFNLIDSRCHCHVCMSSS